MNVAPHLIRLYRRTSRRYKKLISKLQRAAGSSYERKAFPHEPKKLVKILRRLQAQMKIAAATGTSMLMLNANQVQAQSIPTTLGPFIKHNRLSNPLREPTFTRQQPALATVDFDRDADLDIVVGEYGYNGETVDTSRKR